MERRTFTFDGKNSADFGLYIAGDSVYDAPTRDMDMITIPGRNGQLSIDQGRFENITVTYPAFIWADTQAEFRQKLRAIRNWLTSKHSYYKLSDNYNPESYRLGIYKSGLEVEPVFYNRAGRFELSFDCKPQRFLTEGDEQTVIGIWGDTETKTGEIVLFENEGKTGIKSLVANIEPMQSGTGDPSPSNVRPISGWDSVNVTRTGENLLNGVFEAKTIGADGTITGSASSRLSGYIPINGQPITVSIKHIDGGASNGVRIITYDENKTFISRTITSTVRTDGYIVGRIDDSSVKYVRVQAFVTSEYIDTFMVEFGTERSGFEPMGEAIAIDLGRTVYGGTLDVVSGVLTVKWVTKDMGTMSWEYNTTGGFFTSYITGKGGGNFNLIADCYAITTSTSVGGMEDSQIKGRVGYTTIYVKDSRYTDASTLKSALSGHLVCYELAEPQTYQLTPTQVRTLLGTNNIWADSGDISVEIGEDPNVLINPTPFESLPIIEVRGSGTLTVNNESMTIANSGTTIIDSEMMEAYEEESGAIVSRNDTISGEFPKLKEGVNYIDTVGLTSVKVKPKWWEA